MNIDIDNDTLATIEDALRTRSGLWVPHYTYDERIAAIVASDRPAAKALKAIMPKKYAPKVRIGGTVRDDSLALGISGEVVAFGVGTYSDCAALRCPNGSLILTNVGNLTVTS